MVSTLGTSVLGHSSFVDTLRLVDVRVHDGRAAGPCSASDKHFPSNYPENAPVKRLWQPLSHSNEPTTTS